jgi:hypothetical protein
MLYQSPSCVESAESVAAQRTVSSLWTELKCRVHETPLTTNSSHLFTALDWNSSLCCRHRRRCNTGRPSTLVPERKSKCFLNVTTLRATVFHASRQRQIQPPATISASCTSLSSDASTKSILHRRQSQIPSYGPHLVPGAILRAARVDVCQIVLQ